MSGQGQGWKPSGKWGMSAFFENNCNLQNKFIFFDNNKNA